MKVAVKNSAPLGKQYENTYINSIYTYINSIEKLLMYEQDFIWKWLCLGFPAFVNLIPHFGQKISSQYAIQWDNNI